MTIASHSEFRALVEDRALQVAYDRNQTPVAFSFTDPEHVVSSQELEANPAMRSIGRLFEQEGDFFIVEPEVDAEAPNISQYSFKNVYGGLSCYYCTKNDQLDSLNWAEAEYIARGFAHTNMTSVVFRGLTFGQQFRHRGFRVYPIDVPFEFRVK